MTDKQPAGNSAPDTAESGLPGLSPADTPETVVALTVAYQGSCFSGFAKQDGQCTVQGELEQALRTLYHHEIATTGAGRTDAGVHALGNVVSFGLTQAQFDERSVEKLQSSLNALVPDALVVKKIEQKPADFSARFSAQAREYRYRIVISQTPPLFLEPYVWWIKPGPLDITAMKEAALLFEGEHDFRSFCVAKSADLGPTTRRVSRVHLFSTQHLGEQNLVVQVIGNAFLHSMVRVMVGTLVEVGLRKQPPSWIGEVLEARDRRCAGQTAPAKGLTLWRVLY
ncbi:MAG: tRNA pseudouridine(38-40) synthase TruA [Coriobacteriales bacterium]|jgi:tRNA pseudouridine38-40 synthase|nr:tRNA pseudouridine(38-40) synthase TruA [Coriobacteriales bacterium]